MKDSLPGHLGLVCLFSFYASIVMHIILLSFISAVGAKCFAPGENIIILFPCINTLLIIGYISLDVGNEFISELIMHVYQLFVTSAESGRGLQENIRKVRERVSKLIDCDLDFLEALSEKKGEYKVITCDQIDEIRKQSDVLQKNNQLLDCILNSDKVSLNGLMQTLEETGQKHIANFISSGGGRIT